MSERGIEKGVLATSSLAGTELPDVLAPTVNVAAERRRFALQALVLAALLLLLPLFTYAPTTFHDYGLRDDYSNLREAHEEPGKILKFCASHARPIYGQLLQASYGMVTSVQNLQWMRFTAAMLLGVLSLVCFRSLRALGWKLYPALWFAMLVALLPSAQVVAAWALGWPYAIAAIVGIAAFFVAEGALAAGITWQRASLQGAVALALMVTSVLIYQPSALFYVLPLTASVLARRERSVPATLRHAGIHIGFIALSLGAAYALMSLLYTGGYFIKSGRIAFEQHLVEKLTWWLREPLMNALSLFVLNDNNHRDQWLYYGCAGLAAAVLLGGVAIEWRRYGRARGLLWLGALLCLPLVAFVVSLIASERYATYRTIFAMTAVLLCFLVASVDALTARLGQGVRQAIAGGVLVVAFGCAQYHPFALIAVTQGNEWKLIMDGAEHVSLGEHKPKIFAVASTPSDRSTESIYHDEFGSLSTNSEWVPKEMFKRAMHDLKPNVANLEARYDFAEGPKLPAGQHYDVIIDLHRLRRFYTDN